jgi:phosphoesterase RecJ-like protein
VDPHASSTGEMIFKLFKIFNVKLNQSDAILLYVAILTDTGSFRYPNTTRFAHEMAAELLKFNISVNKIYQKIYETNLFSDAMNLNRIMSTMQRHKNGKVIWMDMPERSFPDGRVKPEQAESVLSFARTIKGVEVVVLFKPTASDEITRVSFRSHGKVDVNRIAAYFGGGGHKTASGCTIKEPLEVAKTWVLKVVDQEIDRIKNEK